MKKHFDFSSMIIIVLTFILFATALFTTGFTHDLLLEAGVLLVSIKLIMMSYQNSLTAKKLMKNIEEIKQLLSKES